MFVFCWLYYGLFREQQKDEGNWRELGVTDARLRHLCWQFSRNKLKIICIVYVSQIFISWKQIWFQQPGGLWLDIPLRTWCFNSNSKFSNAKRISTTNSSVTINAINTSRVLKVMNSNKNHLLYKRPIKKQ